MAKHSEFDLAETIATLPDYVKPAFAKGGYLNQGYDGAVQSTYSNPRPQASGAEETFEEQLDHVLGNVKDLLMAKNAAYGDAALDPLRFHSSASPVEQLNVRMDDKLSRMTRGSKAGEDTPLDYVGYWFLREIARAREAKDTK